MKKTGPIFALTLALFCASIGAQSRRESPGNLPYTPTRIDWLTTVLQASLRQDMTVENGFELEITTPGSETVLIYVRYMPTVDRQIMNQAIDTARKVIHITAKGYGWDEWVLIKEDVKMASGSARKD